MATKMFTELVDDITGGPADETVLFSLDGVEYAIDVSDEHAKQLRESLSEFVGSARRVGGRVRRGLVGTTPSQKNAGANAGAIREWAVREGIELADRGRIPLDVVERYNEAHGDDATKSAASPARRKATTSSTTRKRGTRTRKS